jgi:pSer/pThr/pTyr-binding forkhead associated (FHA) protein
MIRLLLIEITRNRRGEEVRSERIYTDDSLTLGRGTKCSVHLPDPRIQMLHATIRQTTDTSFYLYGNDTQLSVNDTYVGTCNLLNGTRIQIGPYLFVVEYDRGDFSLVMNYELVQPLAEDREVLKRNSQTTLAQTGVSKRMLAWAFSLMVLAACLVVPLMSKPSAKAAAHPIAAIGKDDFWNPGPLSSGHQAFANDCKACHQKPFVQVEDQSCLTCHSDTQQHIADQKTQLHFFADSRCSDCHTEHKAQTSIATLDSTGCVDCHGDKNKLAGHTSLATVGDFANHHPPFKLSINEGGTPQKVSRVVQTAAVKENSGLKFPHDVHLSSKGINSPDGRKQLQCNSCHTPDAANVRFEPISMEKHCSDCHRLEFEPAVTQRQVPHGSEREVMNTLREFYAGLSIGDKDVDVVTVDGLLRRPQAAQPQQSQQQASQWALRKANMIAKELFEVRVCSTCHQVNPIDNTDVPWKIMPVTITQHWFPKARFEHAQHTASQCSTCHSVADSKLSGDIAIPDLASCQTCHSGSTPTVNKITSTCDSCHGFHINESISALNKNPHAAVAKNGDKK